MLLAKGALRKGDWAAASDYAMKATQASSFNFDAWLVRVIAARRRGDVKAARSIPDFDRDYILAGGLSPDNVGEAVTRLRPYAVDVSSGVEEAGIKDFSKMKAFASEVRKI